MLNNKIEFLECLTKSSLRLWRCLVYLLYSLLCIMRLIEVTTICAFEQALLKFLARVDWYAEGSFCLVRQVKHLNLTYA